MLRCGDCGVVFFRRPIEEPTDYQDYYPYLDEFDAGRFAWELAIRRHKYEVQLRAIRRLSPDARRLLDVGAGPGYLCKVAVEQGWTAIGVEPSVQAVDAGKREFGVVYATLESVPNASQDAIACHHVLEHVEQPSEFLRTLRDKLAPGGILVIQVPHREPLTFMAKNGLRRARGAKERSCQLYYPEHITGFDKHSLERALRPHGFDCIAVRCASMWSSFYDPFFLRNYFVGADGRRVQRVDYRGLAQKLVKGAAENVGNLVGRGDWLVGHFRVS